MQQLSDAFILNLPKMENTHYLALTQVHHLLQLYAILTDQECWYIALSVLQMLDLFLNMEFRVDSPAIATYGNMVIIQFGDMNTAHHYVFLTLRLQETIGIKQGSC
jgi:hypothetical protein